jgi:hypothetical protein
VGAQALFIAAPWTCCTAMSRIAEPRANRPAKEMGVKPTASTSSQVPWAGSGPSVKPAPWKRTVAPLTTTGDAMR